MAPTALIVSPRAAVRRKLARVIESIEPGTLIGSHADPWEALVWATYKLPDVIITDHTLPQLDSADFIARLRRIAELETAPLALVCEPERLEARLAAADITDFLSEPLHFQACRIRMRLLFSLRRQQKIITQQARWLNNSVITTHHENVEREKEILQRLARAGEYRDEHTGQHISRIGDYSAAIAHELGMDGEYCDIIRHAAPMHDIGKIGIPDAILRKPKQLSEEERRQMENHTLIGFQILKDSPSRYLQMGAEIALAHHERYDGQGYPFGLTGEQIPLSARIVAVADVFDALSSERPYKGAWDPARVTAYLEENRGTQLDPRCVDAFLRVLRQRARASVEGTEVRQTST